MQTRFMGVALALSLVSCGGEGGSQQTAPVTIPPTSPQPAPPTVVAPITSRSVLFIGGSVTQGAWASAGNSYAEQVSQWLRTKFDSVTVKNVAVGGTNSEFGAYRLEQDMAGFKPDIAFVEFSVNDPPNDKAFVYGNVDGLIYKLRKINPDVVIVYIASTYPGEEPLRRAGSRDQRGIYAQEVVEKNGGIFVDAGFQLWHHIILENRNPQDFFTDQVHPNDLGHTSYYYSVSQALSERITTAKGAGSVTSTYIAQSKLDTARLVDPLSVVGAKTCAMTTSSRLEFVGQGQSYYGEALECQANQGFTVNFSGTSIGITELNLVDGGDLSCRLDGGSPVTVSSSDTVSRISPKMLFRFQSDGPHAMACQASGHVFIGDFLISQAAGVTP